jgi:hypothetical protein
MGRRLVSGGASRRGFFRELLRSAARAAEEFGDAIRDAEELTLPDYDEEYRVETVPAAPAARLASVEELRTLCADVDLAAHADPIVALAQTGLRLTAGYSGDSYLGGVPELPDASDWPDGFACVATLALDQLPETELPRAGTMVVLAALPPARPAARVLVVDGPAEPVERPRVLPVLRVLATAELTLPAAPPDGVDDEAWLALRERLAAAQGVELEEIAGDYGALHRVLGHPDALDAGLADEAGAPESRLLFQLSGDDRLGVTLGYERLTLWIRDDDLRAQRFDRIRAYVG